MFVAIDAGDWAALGRLYADDCVYQRPGFEVIEGDGNRRFRLNPAIAVEKRVAGGAGTRSSEPIAVLRHLCIAASTAHRASRAIAIPNANRRTG